MAFGILGRPGNAASPAVGWCCWPRIWSRPVLPSTGGEIRPPVRKPASTICAGNWPLSAPCSPLKRSWRRKVDTARDQGGAFVDTYMTPRRTTYSTVLSELNQMAGIAGIKTRETGHHARSVEGSASLSMLTITAGTKPLTRIWSNS